MEKEDIIKELKEEDFPKNLIGKCFYNNSSLSNDKENCPINRFNYDDFVNRETFIKKINYLLLVYKRDKYLYKSSIKEKS